MLLFCCVSTRQMSCLKMHWSLSSITWRLIATPHHPACLPSYKLFPYPHPETGGTIVNQRMWLFQTRLSGLEKCWPKNVLFFSIRLVKNVKTYENNFSILFFSDTFIYLNSASSRQGEPGINQWGRTHVCVILSHRHDTIITSIQGSGRPSFDFLDWVRDWNF